MHTNFGINKLFCRGWLRSGLLVALGILGVGAGPVRANALTLQSPQDSVAPSSRYDHEHLQTDPAAYARYSRPGLCQAVALRANNFYMRDKRPDTLRIDPRTDTFPTIVKTVAKACGSKFDVATVPARDLPGLLALALWSGESERAAATAARLQSGIQALPVAERARAWSNMAEIYYWAFPRRNQDILALARQIDSLGAPGAIRAWETYSLLLPNAVDANDLATGVQLGEAAIRAASKMSSGDRADEIGSLNRTYNIWSEATRLRDGTEQGMAVLKRSEPDLLSMRPDPDQQQMVKVWIENDKYKYQFYGKTAPLIQARHWFRPTGDTISRPQAGKVTLIAFVQPNCGGECYPFYSYLQRVHAQYAAQGLEIVLVARTSGYFRSQLIEKTADEVELIRKYYQEFLKVPGILAVVETQFSRLSDGRRIPEADANEREWPRSTDLMVVDRDRKFKTLSGAFIVQLGWKLLNAEIEETLRQ